MSTTRISLDNPVFAGRLRTFNRRSAVYTRRSIADIRPNVPGNRQSGVTAVAKQKVAPAPQPQMPAARAAPTGPRTTKSKVLKRSSVHAPSRTYKPRKKPSPKAVLFAFAAILFLFGIGVGIDGLLANKQVIAQVQSVQQSSSADDDDGSGGAAIIEDIPDEEKRPDIDAYRVAADLPRALYIPKIDAKARIVHMGITRDGAIAAPASIFDAGWYKESAKPGQPGAMFVDGHVHGPTQSGVFFELKKLQAGDKIQVERGDGTMFTYSVVKTEKYTADNVDMGVALNSAVAGKPALNLMTCAGKYSVENGYDQRLVVFAVLD